MMLLPAWSALGGKLAQSLERARVRPALGSGAGRGALCLFRTRLDPATDRGARSPVAGGRVQLVLRPGEVFHGMASAGAWRFMPDPQDMSCLVYFGDEFDCGAHGRSRSLLSGRHDQGHTRSGKRKSYLRPKTKRARLRYYPINRHFIKYRNDLSVTLCFSGPMAGRSLFLMSQALCTSVQQGIRC